MAARFVPQGNQVRVFDGAQSLRIVEALWRPIRSPKPPL